MILDNKNENQKVYEWLKEYTESGKIDIVTGYFTVGALAYLSRQINDKIKNFRMVLGDIVNIDMIHDRTLITWYHHKRNTKAKKGLFPKVLVGDLKKLPIKSPVEKYTENLVVNIVSIIIFTMDNEVNDKVFYIFDSLLDAIVFELYFPAHMKERKIDILQFVKNDIEEVVQGKTFETLKDTQKEQVITELHNCWSDPDSEIVKRMNSFVEKSPEILKPILEGSK